MPGEVPEPFKAGGQRPVIGTNCRNPAMSRIELLWAAGRPFLDKKKAKRTITRHLMASGWWEGWGTAAAIGQVSIPWGLDKVELSVQGFEERSCLSTSDVGR